MARFGAILAYDGTAYQGFQRQPEPTPTIQAALEAAISAIAGLPVGIVGAGRTDAGVHASGQVIAFDLVWKHEERELLNAINSQLPRDIALQRIWQRADFHPRFDALWRQYTYSIATVGVRQPLLERQVWQLTGERLDIESMNAAAAICLGEHDFAAFGTAPQLGSTNTVRQVFVSHWESQKIVDGMSFRYRIRGTAFLYHMVRRLVGAMAQVGRGKLSLAEFSAILESRDLERSKVLAPPNGLIFEAVGYPQEAAEVASARATWQQADEAALEETV